MKKIIAILGFILVISGVYLERENLAKWITETFLMEEKINDVLVNNSYARNSSYSYLKLTDDFTPENKDDLINIFYTFFNSGMDSFSFYCSDMYTDCLEDVNAISKDRTLLSNINGFVHPYNSFKDLETFRYIATGKVTLNVVSRNYKKENIDVIDQEIDRIITQKITDEMKVEEKIKVLHDYIIEKTKYDSKRSDEQISEYDSVTAYGPLFQGYGICSGYSDTMMLFLDKLKIPNFKIASENHIWNLVYANDTWLHLDLTWDDPILDNGKEIIDYEYFLITTKELLEKKDNQHYFNEDIFQEAK